MRITFLGADHEVTGSCHFLQAAGLNILVDCGMEQVLTLFFGVPFMVLLSVSINSFHRLCWVTTAIIIPMAGEG